jgi:hypothetical protein
MKHTIFCLVGLILVVVMYAEDYKITGNYDQVDTQFQVLPPVLGERHADVYNQILQRRIMQEILLIETENVDYSLILSDLWNDLLLLESNERDFWLFELEQVAKVLARGAYTRSVRAMLSKFASRSVAILQAQQISSNRMLAAKEDIVDRLRLWHHIDEQDPSANQIDTDTNPLP